MSIFKKKVKPADTVTRFGKEVIPGSREDVIGLLNEIRAKVHWTWSNAEAIFNLADQIETLLETELQLSQWRGHRITELEALLADKS